MASADDGWRVQSFPLPSEAALDGPLKNARIFRLELFGEVRVSLLFADGDGKWNQVQSAPDGFVH